MKITDEMIRNLQKKIDVSYEEAEGYLRRAKGDVDQAAQYFYQNQNSYKEQTKRNIKNGFSNFIKYRVIITHKEDVIVNIPIAIMLLLSVFVFDTIPELFFVAFISFIIILATESEIKIIKVDKKDESRADDFQGDGAATTTKEENNKYTEKQRAQTAPPGAAVSESNVNREIKENKEIKEIKKITESDDDYYEITIDE